MNMLSTAHARLTNAELPAGDRPEARRDEGKAPEGYWHGSATSHVQHYRARALAAENALARLREALAGWRPAT